MAAVTVVKTIGSTGTFSTPQLWEDGAPASLTTAELSAAGSFAVASFIQGEALTFVGSGATGKFLDTDSTGPGTGSFVTYGITAGNPAAGDVVTGGTSGATCVLSSSTAVNVGVIWQGQTQNQEFTATGVVLTISGSTSSASAYKELTTVAGASFRDNANAQTNALRYNAANGAGIRATAVNGTGVSIIEANARVSKLQIGVSLATSAALSASQANNLLENLILEGTVVAAASTSGTVVLSSSATMRNSIVIQRATAADHILGTSTGSPSLFNCTFVAADDLAAAPASILKSGASGTVTVKNCALFAGDPTSAIVTGSATYTFTTCYSDISGTTGVTQTTFSSEFQDVNDATRDFRLKTGAAQIDTGTTDATNAAFDIVGTSRPNGVAYDVSAWEFVPTSAGPPTNIIWPNPPVPRVEGWTRSTPPTLMAAAVRPLRVYDWPPLRAVPLETRTQGTPATLLAASVMPHSAWIWTAPAPPAARAPWVQNNPIYTTPATAPPFAFDWSRQAPLTAKRIDTSTQSTPPTLLAATVRPPAVAAWPAPQSAAALASWTQSNAALLAAPVGVPVVNYNWPTPAANPTPASWVQSTALLLQQAPVNVPLANYDWSAPFAKPTAVTWVQSTSAMLQAATVRPPAMVDWANQPQSGPSQRTSVQPSNVVLLATLAAVRPPIASLYAPPVLPPIDRNLGGFVTSTPATLFPATVPGTELHARQFIADVGRMMLR